MAYVAYQYEHDEEEASAQLQQSLRPCRTKKRRRTESRKRERLPSLSTILQTLFVFGLAAPSYSQAQTQHLRRAQVTTTSSPPSAVPSASLAPSQVPSLEPSLLPSVFNSSEPLIPSTQPSIEPSELPSLQPSLQPSLVPSQSRGPSQQPSDSLAPSLAPSAETTLTPSRQSLAPSEPVSFRTTPCTADPEIVGYEEVGSLLADLVEYEVHQPFILCPNTTFDDMEIIIGGNRTIPLTVSCGGINCHWVAASGHHLIVTDPNANLTFTGITFMGAQKSSILLENGAADMHVQFENCSWTGNSGNQTIMVEGELVEVIVPVPPEQNSTDNTTVNSTNNSTGPDDNSTDTSSEVAVPARFLQETGPLLSASLVGCRFFNNSAPTAIVVSSRADLLLESCTFEDNFMGSLVVIDSGVVNLQLLRAESNFYTEALIVIGENATLTSSESICTLSNTPSEDDICQGILAGDNCEVIEQCETGAPSMAPSLVPSGAPSFVARACYDSLQTLQAAIDDASSRPDRATVRVCAGAVLDGDEEWMYSPIMIETGDIRFECGETGKLSEQCLFHGGDVQLHIGPGVKRVLFSGFSMVNARQISVVAAGSSGSEALFDHCQWRFNTAVAGVLVYNEAEGERYTGQHNLEQLAKPSSPSMSVAFDASFFEENSFSYSSVACVAANVFFKAVVFQDQAVSRLGAIGATQGSEVGISSSCFIDNEALLEGIIVLDASSNITRNVQNFGEKNGAVLGACITVFNDVTGTCAIDGTCQGDCLPFTAQSCSPSTLSIERPIGPTPPPVAAPTPVPELPPTPVSNGTDPGDGENGGADNSGSSGPSGIAIAVAVIAVLVILVVGCWCFRRGKKKKGGGKKNPKKAPSFKGSTPSRSLRKMQSKNKKKKKKHDDDDDDSNSSEDSYGDDDGFYDEDNSESLRDQSSKKETPEKGGGWFGRGSGGKDKKEKKEKGKKGKGKNGKQKKKPKKSRRRSNGSDDDSDDDDDDDDDESDASEEEEDEESEEEEEEKPKRWKGKKKGKKEKSKKKKKVKKDKNEKSGGFWASSSSNDGDLSSSFSTAAQKAKGAAVIASVTSALS